MSVHSSFRVFAVAAALGIGVNPAFGVDPVQSPHPGKLVVHEWGTFLSVQGSDGVTLGGMVDSEERLPRFVEERSLASWGRAMFQFKMETPVTFFYVDHPTRVDVRVDMRSGVLTHWYPPVYDFGPPPGKYASKRPEKSFIHWTNLTLLPGTTDLGKAAAGMHPVSAEDPWRFCRETDAALVQKKSAREIRGVLSKFDENEKFLFYRGVGAFSLPLEVKSEGSEADVAVTLHNNYRETLKGVVLLAVEKENISIVLVRDLPGGERRSIRLADAGMRRLNLSTGVPAAKEAVAETLVAAGLYVKEAKAMVNTWERSYFRTPGVRVLYQLPRSTTDSVIPLTITPKPTEIVRVMVGRVEVLTPGMEGRVGEWLKDLNSRSHENRLAAERGLEDLGRLREPTLRRIAVLGDDEVRKLAAGRLAASQVGGN